MITIQNVKFTSPLEAANAHFYVMVDEGRKVGSTPIFEGDMLGAVRAIEEAEPPYSVQEPECEYMLDVIIEAEAAKSEFDFRLAKGSYWVMGNSSIGATDVARHLHWKLAVALLNWLNANRE